MTMIKFHSCTFSVPHLLITLPERQLSCYALYPTCKVRIQQYFVTLVMTKVMKFHDRDQKSRIVFSIS
jgi:hypothetical protein